MLTRMSLNLAHITPRYVVDRVRFEAYQGRNLDKPWLTPAANEILASLLLPKDIGLEWGSGRSTKWFAKRLKHLTSVEHEGRWYERVSRELAQAGITNVDYRLLSLAPGQRGVHSDYVHVSDEFEDGSLGFVLVDGRAREHCANSIVPKLAPGGVLVLDNANWFIDHPTRAPNSRAGKGAASPGWAAFVQRVAGWRHIWTSCGVSDTAIWIRPPS